jgi:hypothetical protein
MKYFFKDKKEEYFNPINRKNELYGFAVETVGLHVYTHWLDGNFPQTLSDDCFIDLEKYTVQFIDLVFLCVLQDQSGLYLGPNFCLTNIPFVWYYKPDKYDETKNKLFQPNHYHDLYLSLTFTNNTKSIEDFYKLNKYIKFDLCSKYKFSELFRTLDQIEPITHILKLYKKNKYKGNVIVRKHLSLCLWKNYFKLDIFKGTIGHDYFSNHLSFDYTNEYEHSSFTHENILICSTDEISLVFEHKKILRSQLKCYEKIAKK